MGVNCNWIFTCYAACKKFAVVAWWARTRAKNARVNYSSFATKHQTERDRLLHVAS